MLASVLALLTTIKILLGINTAILFCVAVMIARKGDE